MTRKKGYGDGCLTAHALDLIGERWALLVVRELMLGPKRYGDLQASLRGVSSNILSRRLRDLEDCAVVRRRKLGPPASTWVYELTDWGAGLKPVLVALGRWGTRSPFRDPAADTSADAMVFALYTHFDPGPSAHVNTVCALHLGEDHFIIRLVNGRLDIARGEAVAPDAVVESSFSSLRKLLTGEQSGADALAVGELVVSGDASIVEYLFPGTGQAALLTTQG